jgi:hypothetical protein
MPLKLLNWNAEWAAAKWKAEEMQRRIGQHAADIVCLTETDTAFDAARDGHSICAQAKRGLCSQLPYHRFTVDPDHLCTKSPIYQINKRFSLTTSPVETFLKHLNHHSRHAGIFIHHQMA